jgi:predicted nuclease of predicted toxin-antitoxin system
MRLLLDQNLRVQTKTFLRELGYDVIDTRDLGLMRASDREIAEVAKREDRIIVTYNSDFGDIRHFPPGQHSGIIRLRIHPQTEEILHPRLKEFLESVDAEQLQGALVILDNFKARIRR